MAEGINLNNEDTWADLTAKEITQVIARRSPRRNRSWSIKSLAGYNEDGATISEFLRKLEDYEGTNKFEASILPKLTPQLQKLYRSESYPFDCRYISPEEIAYILEYKTTIRTTDPNSSPWSIGSFANWIMPTENGDEKPMGRKIYTYYDKYVTAPDATFSKTVCPFLPDNWQSNYQARVKYHERWKLYSWQEIADELNTLTPPEKYLQKDAWHLASICNWQNKQGKPIGKSLYDYMTNNFGTKRKMVFESKILPLLKLELQMSYRP